MSRHVDEGSGVSSDGLDSDIRPSRRSSSGVFLSFLLLFVQGKLNGSLFIIGPEGRLPRHVSNVNPEGVVSFVNGYPRAILGVPRSAIQGFHAHLTVGIFDVGAGEPEGNLREAKPGPEAEREVHVSHRGFGGRWGHRSPL